MTDMLDLHSVQIVDAPADIADWSVTTEITRLVMRPTGDGLAGLAFTFDAQARWPGVIPAGWGTPPSPADRVVLDPHVDGAIQYTVWAVMRVHDQWTASAFIQMWAGRPSTGAPILTDFHTNWAYASRWGAANDYIPLPGDHMGFFVSAGNARDGRGVTTVHERSNVVLVPLPAGDVGEFVFSPESLPAPQLPPLPPAPPPPIDDEASFLDQVDKLIAAGDRIVGGLTDVKTSMDALIAKVDELQKTGVPAKLSF